MANRDRILHQVQRWEDLLDLGDPLDTTAELKAETAQLLGQRERFLAWVMRHPKPSIYVALYPKSEFELVGDEGDESADHDAGDPDPTEGTD